MVIRDLIMSVHYKLFENQLEDACEKFPNLRIKTKDEKKYLKGILDIRNSEQKNVRSFLVEIHYSKDFPYRFPLLLEVGTDIPRHPDWHKYNDDSCCITVEPDEILQCINGITVTQFIYNNVIPYLANQSYKMITGKYKNEYPHGKEGLIAYYNELFQTSDISKWGLYIDYAFGIKKLRIGRNEKCICGSPLKMKKCHSIVFDKLKQIGKQNLIEHLKQLS